MSNEEKLLDKINACTNPRRVLTALSFMVGKPGINDVYNAGKKREVSIGQLAALTHKACGHQKAM